jgi:hypothetical protein
MKIRYMANDSRRGTGRSTMEPLAEQPVTADTVGAF